MGLLDMAGSLLGGQSGGGDLIQTVLRAVNSQPGGLAGLVSSLEQGGLGDAVKSWISTGQNMPVSGSQLAGALGNSGLLQSLAGAMGGSTEAAAGQLSGILPGLVDQLTPNGSLPEGGLSGAAGGLLSGLLGRL